MSRTSRPVIGLNASVSHGGSVAKGAMTVGLAYVDAVVRAGGIPLVIPPLESEDLLEAALEPLDGFCFIGGPDYDPRHYAGRVQRAEELMDARRDRFDLALARRVLDETALPVLGVCGGCQLISLARGGALVQDLKSEWVADGTLPHARDQRPGEAGYHYRHALKLEADSLLARTLQAPDGGEVASNSFHHQAVRPERVGDGLRASAWAPDGVIEAIEPAGGAAFARGNRFVLGVQWHPERMPEDARQRALFEALVNAASAGG